MVAASAPQGRLFLLDSGRPWLAELDEAAPLDAAKARVWDFSGYRHSVPASSDGGEPAPLTLYPALYPLGAQGRAVAIVSTVRETYSGGSAFFDSADFIALDELPKPSASPPAIVYAGVPFACGKMVRACFFEKEYKRSLNCNDTSDGHLTIGFDGKGTPPGWSLCWHETNWPAHVAKTKQRTTHSAFSLPAGPRAVAEGASAQAVSFCGGPA